MVKGNFLGKMNEEIPLKKSRFTEARTMALLRQAECGLPLYQGIANTALASHCRY